MALEADIVGDGGALIERGFVFALTGTNSMPEIGGVGVTKLVNSSTIESFITEAQGLLSGTNYSVRSFISNPLGTVYSAVATFTTGAYGDAPGDLQIGFNPGANGEIKCFAVQADGKVLVGGWFSTLGGASRSCIARLNSDGTLDSGFNPAANNTVNAVAVLADGKMLVAGNFTSVAGAFRSRIARLNADGTLDAGYDPNANATVNTLALQADGKVLIGGDFTSVGGWVRNRIARLNADGTLDTGYNPNANATVNTLALQADGKALIGGAFTSLGGVSSFYIGRLNTDGTVDSGFYSHANNQVTCLALQADGKIVLGGSFTTMNGMSRHYIARLNTSGTLDHNFSPYADSLCNCLVLQADGKILLGGNFTFVNSVNRRYVARLHASGKLDYTFNPNPNLFNTRLALQADGSVLLGGNFVSVAGVSRMRLARLTNDAPVQSLTIPSPGRVLWTRGGAAPDTNQVTFEQSLDNGATWTLLGQGARIAGTADWEITGITLDAGAKVRATGRTRGGSFDGSSGLIRQAYPVTPATFGMMLTATAANGTDSTSAMTLGAEIVADGGELFERGFVLASTSVNSQPEIGGTGVTKLAVSGTTGILNALAAGLTPGTPYSFRVYATNSQGASYSQTGTFTTLTIHQGWRHIHFGHSTNTGDAADTADPDSDGLPNMAEYATGSNPLSAASGKWPSASLAISANDGLPHLSVSVNLNALASGVSVSAEVTDDLSDWPGNSQDIEIVSDTTENNIRTMVFRDVIPAVAASSGRFMRLRFTAE
jgi:uncharacterized delta-60 repeat protein